MSFRSFLLLISITLCRSAIAQSPHADLAYRFGLLTAASHVPNLVNQGYGSGAGTSAQHTIGVTYTRSLFLLSENFAIDASAGLSQAFGQFSAPAFTLAYRSTNVRLQPSVRYDLSGFEMTGGIWGDIPITQSLTESVVSNGQTKNNGAILYSSFPYGIRLDAALRNSGLGRIPITPAIFGELDLQAYGQSPYISLLNCMSVGIALQWHFEKNNADAFPVSSAAVTPKPVRTKDVSRIDSASAPRTPPTPISGSVYFTENGQRIARGKAVSVRLLDTLVTQYTMLPHWIGLTDDRESVAHNYVRLSSGAASAFTIDSLSRLPGEEIARNLLNIIGHRMTEVRSSAITIAGPRAALAEVSDYVHARFGISAARIHQKPHPEMNRVEIQRTILLEPVVTTWIERSYDLSQIGVSHEITNAPDSSSWDLELFQDSVRVTHADREHANITLRNIGVQGSSSLIAKLHVSAADGRSTEAEDTLKIVHSSSPADSISSHLSRFIFLADTAEARTVASLGAKMFSLYSSDTASMSVVRIGGGSEWLERQLFPSGMKANIQTGDQAVEIDDLLGKRLFITISGY